MVNPYSCYAFAFSAALIAYLLGWSDLYPSLSFPVFLFLGLTIIVFTAMGVMTKKSKRIMFKKLDSEREIYPVLITLFIYGLWSIEFLYEGGIPLLKILLKLPYNYRLFGVPSLHVFVVTFSSFYTVFLFHLYLSKRSRLLFLLYCVNLIAAVLIYNRAMLFFNLSATLSLYLIYKGRVTLRQITAGSLSVILLFFFFGVLGSLRVSREARKPYTNDTFLKTGKASESFRRSIIPPEFFWVYIYLSSPLANLQNNINTRAVEPFTAGRFLEWTNNEILPDFISKRINAYGNKSRETENTIPGPFNASTIYSRSYSYLGWSGVALMGIVLLFLPLVLFQFLPESSPFFLTGLTLLNTIFLFAVFDNTLRFTGLSFQLVYPFLFHYASQRIGWLKSFFVNNKVTTV